MSKKLISLLEGPESTWNSINDLDKKVNHVPSKQKTWKRKTVFLPKPENFNNAPSQESSNFSELEAKQDFLPKKEKDADATQLQPNLDETLMTPDFGMGTLGRSLYVGAAIQPGNTYTKNFCPDPLAPEELEKNQGHDIAGTLVAPKNFIPKEARESSLPVLHNSKTSPTFKGFKANFKKFNRVP